MGNQQSVLIVTASEYPDQTINPSHWQNIEVHFQNTTFKHLSIQRYQLFQVNLSKNQIP